MQNHKLTSIVNRLILFISENTSARAKNRSIAQDSAFGWQDFAANEIKTHIIEGDHYSILQPPNLYPIAKEINSILLES